MEQETVWIIAIVALAVGILIGFLMGKSGSSEAQRKTLEEELNGSRAEMDRYKKEVTSHFEQTASLVNELTDQYRKVHQHLATGAQNLCPDQAAGRSLQSSLQPKLENTQTDPNATDIEPEKTVNDPATATTTDTEQPAKKDETADTVSEKEDAVAETPSSTEETQPSKDSESTDSVEPPKDWAPKNPEEEGTLSDSYGLKKKAEDAPTPPHPDPGLHEEETAQKDNTAKKEKA